MGKKMAAAQEKIEPRFYELKEAVEAVKQAAFAKYDESVDLAIRLAQQRLNNVLKYLPDPLVARNLQGQVVFCNERFAQLAGAASASATASSMASAQKAAAAGSIRKGQSAGRSSTVPPADRKSVQRRPNGPGSTSRRASRAIATSRAKA